MNRVKGWFRLGKPPKDFCPAENVGIGYVSPGYVEMKNLTVIVTENSVIRAIGNGKVDMENVVIIGEDDDES